MDIDDSVLGTGALDGVRVIDLSGPIGAYCTRLLADLGADVVLVEPPNGDPLRRMPPFPEDDPDTSLLFAYYHASKRSVVVNERDPSALARLGEAADVVVVSPSPRAVVALAGTPARVDPRLGARRDRVRHHAVRNQRAECGMARHPDDLVRDGRLHVACRSGRGPTGHDPRTTVLGRSRRPRGRVRAGRAPGRRRRRPAGHRSLGARGPDRQGLRPRGVRRGRSQPAREARGSGLAPERHLPVRRRPLQHRGPPGPSLGRVPRNARAPGGAGRPGAAGSVGPARALRGTRSDDHGTGAAPFARGPRRAWPGCRPAVRDAAPPDRIRHRPTARVAWHVRRHAHTLGRVPHAGTGSGLRRHAESRPRSHERGRGTRLRRRVVAGVGEAAARRGAARDGSVGWHPRAELRRVRRREHDCGDPRATRGGRGQDRGAGASGGTPDGGLRVRRTQLRTLGSSEHDHVRVVEPVRAQPVDGRHDARGTRAVPPPGCRRRRRHRELRREHARRLGPVVRRPPRPQPEDRADVDVRLRTDRPARV